MYGRRPSFRERVARFMYGRCGYDELSRALWYLCLVLLIVNLFCELLIIALIETALMIYAIYRMMSKNLAARSRENAAYLKFAGKIKGFFTLQKNKHRDRRTHVYRKCPSCRNTLRLPKIKGEHTVNCPCCHTRFDMKI